MGTDSPLLVGLVNVSTRRELNLIEGGQVVRTRALVAVNIHVPVALEISHRVDRGVHGNLLGCTVK